MKRHAFIPDTQVKPGVKTSHITAAGNYIADKLTSKDVVVMIGDWWDMNSLSMFDKPGSHEWEKKSLSADIESGNDAMSDFLKCFGRKKKPKLVFTLGNHEHRMERAAQSPEFRRFGHELSYKRLNLKDWKVYPFLKPVKIDGITYCHYFVNPNALYTNAIGGSIDNKLKKLKCSFTMGHQQTFQVGVDYGVDGKRIRGLVCGRFYNHKEEYLGPQKNAQSTSGIFIKNEVRNGNYDLMEISMDYLLKKWL